MTKYLQLTHFAVDGCGRSGRSEEINSERRKTKLKLGER